MAVAELKAEVVVVAVVELKGAAVVAQVVANAVAEKVAVAPMPVKILEDVVLAA